MARLSILQIAALIGFPLIGLAFAFETVRVQSRMIQKLNAFNPANHQYDQWGYSLFRPRWCRNFYREYRAKFGDDELVRRYKRIHIAIVFIVVPLGLLWVVG